jgi:hypothetical protein
MDARGGTHIIRSTQTEATTRGITMLKKFLIAVAALAALGATTFAAPPVEAGACVVATGKGRGLDQAKATDRSLKHLKRAVNHWAQKNKDKVVKESKAATSCAKQGGLVVCKSSAKVCG